MGEPQRVHLGTGRDLAPWAEEFSRALAETPLPDEVERIGEFAYEALDAGRTAGRRGKLEAPRVTRMRWRR